MCRRRNCHPPTRAIPLQRTLSVLSTTSPRLSTVDHQNGSSAHSSVVSHDGRASAHGRTRVKLVSRPVRRRGSTRTICYRDQLQTPRSPHGAGPASADSVRELPSPRLFVSHLTKGFSVSGPWIFPLRRSVYVVFNKLQHSLELLSAGALRITSEAP